MQSFIVVSLLFSLSLLSMPAFSAAQTSVRVIPTIPQLVPRATPVTPTIPPPTRPVSSGSIEFPEKLPEYPSRLPVMRLAPAPSAALTKAVDRLLQAGTTAGTPLRVQEWIDNSVAIARDPETGAVKAWVDAATGSVAIYPTVSATAPKLELDTDTLAQKFARRALQEFFPEAEGTLVIGRATELRHARLHRSDPKQSSVQNEPTAQLLYVSAQRLLGPYQIDGRTVGPYRVVGPVAPATAVVDGLGNIQGLALSARRKVSELEAPRANLDLKKQIARDLESYRDKFNVHVRSISLVYYDAGRALLQPAFAYVAELRSNQLPNKLRTPQQAYVLGYVPFAETDEPLPSFVGPSAISPKDASATTKTTLPRRDPISIGRYVARNPEAGFVRNANDFWSALASSGSPLPIYDTEYLFAEPGLLTSSASFTQRVNVALFEAHGFPGGIATNGQDEEVKLVDVQEARVARAGGVAEPADGTAHSAWAIHSCSVVASPDDTGTWADPWWAIASTVTSVVGYRTPMYINDGIGSVYGTSLGRGAPLRSAWLLDVASLAAYGDNPYGCTAHRTGQPFGKPAVIATCDTLDRGLEQFESNMSSSPSSAECLDAFWISDSLTKADVSARAGVKSDEEMCEEGVDRFVATTLQVLSCINYDCASAGGSCSGRCLNEQCEFVCE